MITDREELISTLQQEKSELQSELESQKEIWKGRENTGSALKVLSSLQDRIQGMDLTIYELQNIGQLEDKIEYLEKSNEWTNISKPPIKDGEYLVQWEVDVRKNIERAVYEDNKWIAMRDSLNITPKVVAWREINAYERKEQEDGR